MKLSVLLLKLLYDSSSILLFMVAIKLNQNARHSCIHRVLYYDKDDNEGEERYELKYLKSHKKRVYIGFYKIIRKYENSHLVIRNCISENNN